MKSIIKKISYWFFLVLLSLHSSDVYSIHVIKKPSTSGGLSGTVASQAVAFGCGTNTLCGDAAFTFDSTNKWLKIGSSLGTIDAPLHVRTNSSEGFRLQSGTTFPIYLRGKNALVDDIGRIEFVSVTDGGNTRGGAIDFYTKVADNTQGTSATKRIRMSSNGYLGLGVVNTVPEMFSVKAHSSFSDSSANLTTSAIVTTDATTTNLYTKTLTDEYAYYFSVDVIARRTDTGTEIGRFTRKFLVYRSGGGATLAAGDPITPWADKQVTMTGVVDVDVNGNDVRVRVTGENDKTIIWAATVNYQAVFSQF